MESSKNSREVIKDLDFIPHASIQLTFTGLQLTSATLCKNRVSTGSVESLYVVVKSRTVQWIQEYMGPRFRPKPERVESVYYDLKMNGFAGNSPRIALENFANVEI